MKNTQGCRVKSFYHIQIIVEIVIPEFSIITYVKNMPCTNLAHVVILNQICIDRSKWKLCSK